MRIEFNGGGCELPCESPENLVTCSRGNTPIAYNAVVKLEGLCETELVFLMIRYTSGNLLDAQTEALVNTVNEVGVMGKGIALMFREAFPDNTAAYEAACKQGKVRVGRMFVTENHALTGPRWIINFPTKRNWRYPSKLEWVRDGLEDLKRVIHDKKIKSIALPPLGCGNGGLEWNQVRATIESALASLKGIEILVFESMSTNQNTASP